VLTVLRQVHVIHCTTHMPELVLQGASMHILTCKDDVDQGFREGLGFRREPRVWALGYRP
jgi:hypothetical protein